MYKAIIVLALALCGLAPVHAQDGSAAATHLENGKLLRIKADAGDAEAMFRLGILLLEHGPTPKRPGRICDGKPVNPLIKPKPGARCTEVRDPANAALLEQWSQVGTKYAAQSWILKAAEGGNTQAIALLCKMGSDPLAPAATRAEGAQWCERMK
jgi:TPR repeat protein